MSDAADDTVTTQLGQVAVVGASRDDARAILRLRDALATWMVERGIDQWRPGEMPLNWVEECAAQGWLFAASQEGHLIGSVSLVWTDPVVWVDWNEPAGYIHMLMVDREYAGYGIGRSLLGWAERRVERSGHRRARLDCVHTNLGLRAYYENAGYMLVGYRAFAPMPTAALGGAFPAETALYEKVLSE